MARADAAPAEARSGARDEYLDASSNARQYITLRFAELTIFMTATGAILAVSFSAVAAPTSPLAAVSLKIAGLLVAAVFWVLETRTMVYWRHFVHRAAELEAELGFRQYSTRPPEGIVSSHRAIRVLIGFVALFWIVALIFVPAPV